MNEIYMKIVALYAIYIFIVQSFYLKLFIVPEFCLKLFYFKIQLFWLIQITSDEKMIENKVKDLAMIYNFVGDNFFIRNHLGS